LIFENPVCEFEKLVVLELGVVDVPETTEFIADKLVHVVSVFPDYIISLRLLHQASIHHLGEITRERELRDN